MIDFSIFAADVPGSIAAKAYDESRVLHILIIDTMSGGHPADISLFVQSPEMATEMAAAINSVVEKFIKQQEADNADTEHRVEA